VRAALLLGALWAFPLAASAGPPQVRLLVAIGSNLGDPDDAPLRFADADARRVAALLTELGGVSSDRAYVVVNQPAPAVRERLAEVSGRIAELAAAGQDVMLLLYVSAHAEAGVLHLAGTYLPLSELSDYARSTRARLRLLVVDSCDSGALARRKGGSPAPEYEVDLEKLPLHGQVVISSSGPVEASQEWDSLAGSLFTHHWLTGLRGDADAQGDGQVTLAEAYAYAYRRTVAGASQHPSFDIDLAGTGEVVLTEPKVARSALIFPAPLEGRYVVSSQPRPDVVAEVDKRAGRPLRLAVPPGRYVVRKRMGATVGLLNVELPYGGEKEVAEAALVRRDWREVTLKGGFVELHPHAVLAGAGLQSPPLEGTGPRWRAALAYRHSYGEVFGQLSAEAGQSRFRAVSLTTTEQSAALAFAGGVRSPQGPFVPLASLSIEAWVVRQSFQRDQEADIQRLFGPMRDRVAFGMRFGPALGLEVPLWRNLFGLVQVRGLARFLPAQDQPAWTVGLEGYAGVGVTL
jgi:hypothetical protein